MQCEKVNGIISFIELTHGKVKVLKLLTDKAIYQLRKTIKIKGYDYATYTEEEKDQTMLVYNFSLGLKHRKIYTMPLWAMIYIWGVPCLLIPPEEGSQTIKSRLKSFANDFLFLDTYLNVEGKLCELTEQLHQLF